MNFETIARETVILDPLNAKTAVSEYMKYIWRR